MTKEVEEKIESLTPDELLELHRWILSEGGVTKDILLSRFLVEPSVPDEKTIANIRDMIKKSAERAADSKARDQLGLSRVEQIPRPKKDRYKKLKKEHLGG